LKEEVTMFDQMAGLRGAVEAIVAPRSMRIWDLQWSGSTLRVFLDKVGSENSPNLDELEDVSRLISKELDLLEREGFSFPAGRWTLEVSSPGLERALRTPEHFALSVGREITVRARQARLLGSDTSPNSAKGVSEAVQSQSPTDQSQSPTEILAGPLRVRGLLESTDEEGFVLFSRQQDLSGSSGSARVGSGGHRSFRESHEELSDEGPEEGIHSMKGQTDQDHRVRISFEDLLQARTVFEWTSGTSSPGKRRLEKVR
jgi:ribosome maturation factor RimP